MKQSSLSASLWWTLLSRFGAQFTQLAFSLVLARLLSPAEFGLMAMIAVFAGFAQIICEAGLASAVVYFGIHDRRGLSTVFWIQSGLAVAAALCFIASAPLLASFFDSSQLAPLIELVALGFVCHPLNQTQNAMLARESRFKEIGICNYVGIFLGSLVGVYFAYSGLGVWSLAWMSVATAFLTLLCSFYFTRWIPGFEFSLVECRRLISYGLYLVLHNSLNYWMRNGDNLIVGRILGAAPLGIYNRAYTLMLLPLQNIGSILGQVMFPALASLKNDMPEFKRMYLICIRRIAFITFPLMAGMSALAEPFTLLMYGPQWQESAVILSILSLVAMFQCIVFPVGWLFTSLGKTREQFLVSILLFLPFFLLVAGGVKLGGLVGLAIGYAMWALLSGILNIIVAGRFIDVSAATYLLLAKEKAFAAAIMYAAIVVSADALDARGGVAHLVGGILLGGASYVLVLRLLRDQELRWLVEKVGERVPSKVL